MSIEVNGRIYYSREELIEIEHRVTIKAIYAVLRRLQAVINGPYSVAHLADKAVFVDDLRTFIEQEEARLR